MNRQLAVLAIVAIAYVSALTPNEKLKQCCSTLKGADENCVKDFCDFKAISQTNILNYLSTCTEKPNTVGPMWDCASLRHNHTECCVKKNVQTDCLPYCAAQDGVPTNYLDYMFCVEDFNSIRDCFHEHLEKNPPFKGH